MRRIVQFSDPHLVKPGETLKDVDTFSRFQRCVETALHEGASSDLLTMVISGDIAHDESRETYQRLNDYLNLTGAEWFCIPGNHDDPEILFEVMPERCVQPSLGWRIVSLEDSFNLHLLSSHVPGEIGGEINQPGLDSLTDSTSKSKLVVLHHPPIPLNDPLFDAMALGNQEEFWMHIEKGTNILGVLFGHAHRAHEETLHLRSGSVAVLGCPSTAFQYGVKNDHPLGFDPSMFGYRTLTYSGSSALQTEVTWLRA